MNVRLPKPKDWQDFERKTRELLAHVLADPNTRMHGRTGQPQHGVDIWGYRNEDLSKLIGVQCKLSNDEITAAELRAELEKTTSFTPTISEFILVTTAARDATIQQAARELTQSLIGTDRPILVDVWGWEDIEEAAAKHADAWKTFDPTFNPFAAQTREEIREGFRALHSRLETIGPKIPSRRTLAPSETEPPLIQLFFSYAHHDEGTDPELVEAFSKDLEHRVQGRLVKTKFQIWRDKFSIRTGDDWNEEIEQAIRSSDVFLALVTPKWMGSVACQKEFLLFRDIERQVAAGPYVIPIIARNLDQEKTHFDEEQKTIFSDLQRRQYRKVPAKDFRNLGSDKRIDLVENVADDVYGMILRIRDIRSRGSFQTTSTRETPELSTASVKSPISRPHRFPDTDFLRAYEVLIGPADDGAERALYAQAEFFDRLYVEDGDVRLEFGIYRAKLSVTYTGSGKVSRSNLLEGRGRNTYYANPDGEPLTHTVFVEGTSDKPTLGELALMPTKGDNKYAEIARTTSDVKAQDLNVSLEVSLNSEGLYFEDDDLDKPSPNQRAKIAAIVLQLARKEPESAANRRAVRLIPVKERKP
ncbi:MAG: hypothetical protein QOI12_5221 [Alphaproteobacteria bacterium]|jgi:hypothetical protein|nr:hypothetical protein [Alphaproteobacteria bacterium]